MQVLQNKAKTHYALLLLILVLSAYTHLWNPAGFPDIFFDEGIYMRRAINVLETGNPQEAYFYDHPYFGQLVLAGFLKITGFPQTVEQSLELSYMIPRLLMGVFAVVDTWLIYEIAKKRFGRKVAIISSILFAVMPFTWMLRRILLDSILLPFLLSSILLALYSKESGRKNILITASAILLGLAIFTKITAVTMIPVVGYIIFTNSRNLRDLIKWIPPVFAVPLGWPAASLYLGQLDLWLRDVFWQAGRGSGGFWPVTGYLFDIDPAITTLGFASFGYAIYTRNLFLMFWFAPFLLFVSNVGFFQYFHYILIFPVICISIGFMVKSSLEKISSERLQKSCFVIFTMAIAVFGLVATSMLITTDMTSAQFDVIQFMLGFDDSDTTLLAGPAYSWIFSDVYNKENVLPDYSIILFDSVKTKKAILISDPHFMTDMKRGKELQNTYDDFGLIKEFEGDVKKYDSDSFPFQSMRFTGEGSFIEIKASWKED